LCPPHPVIKGKTDQYIAHEFSFDITSVSK
jgi:hypothetical protein